MVLFSYIRAKSVKEAIDLLNHPGIRSQVLAGGHVIIGVAATFTELIRCPFVIHTSPLLAQACGEVGAVQIRNMGTSDGNVANTAACADSIPALVCLGVTAQIAISTMDQELPVSNLVLGPNKTCLPSEELIINFRYPIPQPGS